MISNDFSLNPVTDLQQLFAYHFMVNAFAAGTIVAVMAAVVGHFTVIRRQVFTSHTLSVIAFPGATAAALIGAPFALGYFSFCTLGALVLSTTLKGKSYSATSAAVGTTQAVMLACGFLFISLYDGILTELNTVLFGTFLGIKDTQVATLLAVALLSLTLLALIARPLLFSTYDPEVARARGVPVRLISLSFLLILGLCVAATAQITGTLLIFCLLITPAATARLLTQRTISSLGTAIILAVTIIWTGLTFAYFTPYPVGFWVTSLSLFFYIAARLYSYRRDQRFSEQHAQSQQVVTADA